MSAHTPNYETDAATEEVLLRLDLTLLRSDSDVSQRRSAESEGTARSTSSRTARSESDADDVRPSNPPDVHRHSTSSPQSHNRRKPLDFVRRQRSVGNKSDFSSANRTSRDQLKVDKLPQSFIVKYIGCRACRGLWGIQYTRDPVDTLVDDLRRLDRGDDLPLALMKVSSDGISVAVHARNRSRLPLHDVGLLPLQFISYAVQDTRFSRVFAFVLVRELSSRGRSTECHAYLCDSALSARKLALSVALAFHQYERRLAGKPFRFVVDLSPPAPTDADAKCAAVDDYDA